MIHKYFFEGQYIVIDVNSGAIHVVDQLIYDILDDFKLLSKEAVIKKFSNAYEDAEINDAYGEIEALIEAEMLFSDDCYVDVKAVEHREPVVKALCLHVAHDCNMRCKYCFGSQGDFQGNRLLMDVEIGKKALDFLIENSGNRRNLEVDFFGGEPLMNLDVVKELVDYGRKIEKKHNKNFRFTITTNGLLLNDEVATYINDTMDNVILSIDGRKEVNDEMRYTVDGKGTYDRIVNNYLNFVEKRKDKMYYVRGTYTRKNLDFSKDIFHLLEKGFSNVSVEPVVVDQSIDYALRKEDLPVIFAEYEALAKEFIRKAKNNEDYEFFHFNIDLEQGPCIIKRMVGCGAGTEYMAISPEGDIYPCHQFVGEEDFKLGNVLEPNFTNKHYDFFKDAHVFAKEACRNCWARFYCSGGCHANAYHENNDIYKPYELGCEMEKKRLECAIAVQAQLEG